MFKTLDGWPLNMQVKRLKFGSRKKTRDFMFSLGRIMNMRRPVPISTRLLPALQLKSMTHRALACRWHLGVFHVNYRYLSSIGWHMYLDDLRSLSQKKVTHLELRKIQIARTVISSIPELYCFNAQESWVVWRLAAYLLRRRFLQVSINKTFSLWLRSIESASDLLAAIIVRTLNLSLESGYLTAEKSIKLCG